MYLVDTNVISELSRKKADSGVLSWFAKQTSLAISAVTVEELTYGIERIPSDQNSRLRQWMASLLAIPPEIIPVDHQVAQLAGQLRARLERKGHIVTQADMLIAATALTSGKILVTRNVKDFSDCGVTVLNPWKESSP